MNVITKKEQMKFNPELDAIENQALIDFNAPIHEMEFELDDFAFDPFTIAPAPTPAGTISSPAPPTIGTKKISIRVKSRTLEAIKTQAKATGRPYQRLVNEILQTAVRDWAKLPV